MSNFSVMKRKVLLCLALCAGLGTSALADSLFGSLENIEVLLNANVFYVYNDSNAVALEVNSFLYSPADFLDIGVNMQIDTSPKITLGPVMRFNIGERHSFIISPGLRFVIGGGDSYYSYSNSGISFNLDMGYRFWAISRPGFALGLALGTDLNFFTQGLPTSDYYPDSNSNYEEATTDTMGFALNIYLRIVLNLGDRSIYRF